MKRLSHKPPPDAERCTAVFTIYETDRYVRTMFGVFDLPCEFVEHRCSRRCGPDGDCWQHRRYFKEHGDEGQTKKTG